MPEMERRPARRKKYRLIQHIEFICIHLMEIFENIYLLLNMQDGSTLWTPSERESIITMYVVQRKYDAFKTVHKHLLIVNLTIVIYVWQVHEHTFLLVSML